VYRVFPPRVLAKARVFPRTINVMYGKLTSRCVPAYVIARRPLICRDDRPLNSRFVAARGAGQFIFLGHSFKRFTSRLDAVLKLDAIGRKEVCDLVATDYRRGKSGLHKINELPDAELVARHVCLLRPTRRRTS